MISNFVTWTAKHSAQASCTELTLSNNWTWDRILCNYHWLFIQKRQDSITSLEIYLVTFSWTWLVYPWRTAEMAKTLCSCFCCYTMTKRGHPISFKTLLISMKINEIFVRISALASKKRLYQKYKGTLYYWLDDFTLTNTTFLIWSLFRG